MNPDPRIADEQTHLDAVYGRIDRMRATTNRRLRETLAEAGDTPQALSERESYERLYVDDLAKLDAAEHNLYFGRLEVDPDDDDDGAETRRIGRIGVLDDDDDDTTLLLDWRAPLSRPFYLATPADPDGVRVRRHIRTSNRAVRTVTDEVLDGSAVSDPAEGTAGGVTLGDVVNESALVAALNAARTGEMADIVETIQREQDLIIRSPHRGVTVVQGGPGTGKTAVALHRAAYLLYTHRDLLARSGVLILGPNTDFLRYISQVLPSLGETGVLLSTIGNLLPGLDTAVVDPPAAAVLKGSTDILTVLKRHARSYQSLPKQPVTVRFDGYPLAIDSALVKTARAKARSTRRAHNQAQREFLRSALHGLAAAYASRIGSSLLDGSQMLSGAEIADIRDEMRDDEDLVQAVLAFWPRLEPKRVLSDLLTSATAIRGATPGWSEADRAALLRPAHAPFTIGDVPLLDEIAELIGAGTDDDEAAAQAQWRKQLSEAQEALDILTGSAPQDIEDEIDPEILMAYDLIDAEQLAQRQRITTHRTTAERAYEDRTWTFGHVIVDEAQELSAMAWRMVMRRIPNRWMTVIGDTAQTSNPAGASSWSAVFEPYVEKRWRLHELTVNYRTPAEIMRYAARLLERLDPALTPPTSLRSNGIEPTAVHAEESAAHTAVDLAIACDWPGLTGVIVTDDDYDAAVAALGDRTGVVVHTVTGCKGLEFDTTVVVEPAAIVAASERGLNDLYVALTRATQRLVVVAGNEMPPELADLPGWHSS